MMSFVFAFWMFVIYFAIVGAMRGWAKELLVLFSTVLAIFIVTIIERFVPLLTDFSEALPGAGAPTDFWVRSTLLLVFTFFGYQTPRFPRIASPKLNRDKVQDTILGTLAGAANGYMIVGSLWYYLDQIQYRLGESAAKYIIPPQAGTELGDTALEMIAMLPPNWLVVPWIYFAIAIAFAFVVIVFV